MRWWRGAWFHTTGIDPCNRITSMDLRQEPVMHRPGISIISIHTSGYSGHTVPEIQIEAIEHAEELREIIRAAVRRCSFRSDGTCTPIPGKLLTRRTSSRLPDPWHPVYWCPVNCRKIRILIG